MKQVGVIPPQLMRRCLLLVVAVGIGWRLLRFFLGMPIWGDEASVGLNLMDRGFGDLLKPLEYDQVAPAFFIAGEWGMQQMMGASEYSLRILPTVAGIAALVVFSFWARKVVPPLAALFATGIMAVAFYPVRHSVEVKPYAFDLLASCVLLWVATTWQQKPERTRWLWALGLVMVLAIFSSYPAVFVAGAIVVVLIPTVVRGKSGEMWAGYGIMVGMLLAAVAVSYLFLVVPQQRATATMMNSYWEKGFLPLSFLAAVKWLMVEHVGNLMAYPVGGKNGASALTLVFFLAGAWTMYQSKQRRMLGLLMLPFLLTLIASAMRKYPYGDSARITQHLAPMICLLSGLGVAGIIEMLSSTHRKWATLAVVSCYGVIGAAGAVIDVMSPYKRLADQQTREVVERALGSDEQALVVQNMKKVPVNFQWYLRKERPGLAFGGEWERMKPDQGMLVFNFNRSKPLDVGWGNGRELLGRETHLLKTGAEENPPVFCEITRWGCELRGE